MVTVERVWFATLAAAMVLSASTIWSQRAPAPHVPAVVTPAPTTTSVIDTTPRTLPDDDQEFETDNEWSEPRVDLNGNEIDAAVSDYRVDGRGELYERHAPDTALLHLSAPKL